MSLRFIDDTDNNLEIIDYTKALTLSDIKQ